ncbi:MAG TPA: hypothetical protein VN764_15205, partial [Polyangiaceae bacterium]|nr:hypothetical protein [Polyangiaceae bacterium]
MNRRFSVFTLGLAAITAACSSNDHEDPQALVAVETVESGGSCSLGGTRVTAGADDDGDGQLDPSEIDSTSYLCSAEQGAHGEEGERGEQGKAGEHGERGESGKAGTNGESGADGKPGTPGTPGTPGAPGPAGPDGPTALIKTADELAGERCDHGGTRIEVGLDVDKDGTLGHDEIDADQTRYVCDGAPGDSGVAGFRLVGKFVAPGGPIAEIVSPSPDGNTLVYTSSATGTIGFADISQPTQPALLGTVNLAEATGGDGEPTSVAFSPDGQHVIAVVKDTAQPVTNADPGALVVVSAATRSVVGQVAVGVGPDSVVLTPDGTKAIVAIEDEENEGGNNAPQARPGSVQVVTLDYATPALSSVVTIPLGPTLGNMPSDPQPEYVDVTQDGKTAVVSLQENNVLAVIDLTTQVVTRYLDAGTSTHERSDQLSDRRWIFEQAYEGQLQPDGVCLLPDQKHFITAN